MKTHARRKHGKEIINYEIKRKWGNSPERKEIKGLPLTKRYGWAAKPIYWT